MATERELLGMIEELKTRLDRTEGVETTAPHDPHWPKCVYFENPDQKGPDHPGADAMTVANQAELDQALADGWTTTYKFPESPKVHAKPKPGPKKS